MLSTDQERDLLEKLSKNSSELFGAVLRPVLFAVAPRHVIDSRFIASLLRDLPSVYKYETAFHQHMLEQSVASLANTKVWLADHKYDLPLVGEQIPMGMPSFELSTRMSAVGFIYKIASERMDFRRTLSVFEATNIHVVPLGDEDKVHATMQQFRCSAMNLASRAAQYPYAVVFFRVESPTIGIDNNEYSVGVVFYMHVILELYAAGTINGLKMLFPRNDFL